MSNKCPCDPLTAGDRSSILTPKGRAFSIPQALHPIAAVLRHYFVPTPCRQEKNTVDLAVNQCQSYIAKSRTRFPCSLRQPDAARRVRAALSNCGMALSAPLHRVGRRRPTCRWRRATKSPSSPPITRRKVMCGPARRATPDGISDSMSIEVEGLIKGKEDYDLVIFMLEDAVFHSAPGRLLRRRARWVARHRATGAWTWRLRPTQRHAALFRQVRG